MLLFFAGAAAYAAERDILAYIRSGSTEEVKATVRKDKSAIFVTDAYGNTLFILAARYGHNAILSFLNDEWAQWARANRYGENALHAAIRYQHPSTAALVVSLAEKDPDLEFDAFINRKDLVNFSTPLHLAAQNCDRQLYDLLVQHGANPKLLNKNRQTPSAMLKTCPPPEKESATNTPSTLKDIKPVNKSELPDKPASVPPAQTTGTSAPAAPAKIQAPSPAPRPRPVSVPEDPELEEELDLNSLL